MIKRSVQPLVTVIAAMGVAACTQTREVRSSSSAAAPRSEAPPEKGAMTAATSENPLLSKWTGDYGGVPPFDRVKVEQFKPAMQAAMEQARREIAGVAGQAAPPTFDNTLAALEATGRTFTDVQIIYDVWGSTMSTPDYQAVEREMAPAVAAFWDELHQNEKLFRRIETIYQAPDKAKLSPEQQRLAWFYYTTFSRHGAKLGAEPKKRLSEINKRLAGLYTSFSQNLLKDEEQYQVVLESEADLAGLPDSVRAGAAAAAANRSLKGKWVVTNTRSSVDPFLTYSTRRDLREKAWRNFIKRGDNGDERDTKQIISEILQLRAERAQLLGFPTHAHWRLADTMAKTPERALALMEKVWPAAVARVREEVADMQAIANRERAGIRIEPWDYRFYAEKVRKAKYDLDENQIKPYLQLENMREGMFWVAGELFGFSFHAVQGVPVYHPDVRVWEVKERSSGRHVGLWYFDPYARKGKRSGAWMNAYRNQERLSGNITTIVSNNANFVKGTPGEPVLISWDDARALFHEFGHALHGLSSNVTFPSLSGTDVARDYVEFPSQLLEHWLSTPEVLNRFGLHYQTQKPIPRQLVAKIEKAATFNQGFATVEYLASALVDMRLHLAGAQKIDVDAFERETLKALGMPKEIVMRHRTPQFSHIFAGDGYSAGYYSYLWSDTLTADAFEAFKEGKGPYDREVAARLRQHVFTVGNTIDPAEGYRAFRGRDPTTDALMRKRGFPVSGAAGGKKTSG